MTSTRASGGAGPLDALAAIDGGGFGGIGTPQELVGHGLDERGAHDVLDRCVGLGVGIVDTAAALAALLERGWAGHWGVSNVTHDDLVAWLDTVDRIGLPDPLFVENRYSLLDRDDDAEVLPLCRERGITYLAYSPLAGGVLTGKYRYDQTPPPGSRMALRPEFGARLDRRRHAAIDALAALAADKAVSLAALALAWVLAQPGVRPVVGVSKPQHLDALAAALDMQLDRGDVEAIAGRLM